MFFAYSLNRTSCFAAEDLDALDYRGIAREFVGGIGEDLDRLANGMESIASAGCAVGAVWGEVVA